MIATANLDPDQNPRRHPQRCDVSDGLWVRVVQEQDLAIHHFRIA